MKNLNPYFHKAIPTEEDCKRIKAQEAYYRPRLNKILGERFLELFKMFFKGDKMQEVMKDGSHGKTFVKDKIEDLVPHIKKSLEDPNVKFVKIFMARGPIKNEKIFSAEEQKSSPLDELIEKAEEEDEKELKKARLKIPKKR